MQNALVDQTVNVETNVNAVNLAIPKDVRTLIVLVEKIVSVEKGVNAGNMQKRRASVPIQHVHVIKDVYVGMFVNANNLSKREFVKMLLAHVEWTANVALYANAV